MHSPVENVFGAITKKPRLSFSLFRFHREGFATKYGAISLRHSSSFLLSSGNTLFSTSISETGACDALPSAVDSIKSDSQFSSPGSLPFSSSSHFSQQSDSQGVLGAAGPRTMMTKARRARLAAAVARAEKNLSMDNTPGAAFLHSQRVQELRAEEQLLAASLHRLEAERTLAAARHQCESELETFRRGVVAREAVVTHLVAEGQTGSLRSVSNDEEWGGSDGLTAAVAEKGGTAEEYGKLKKGGGREGRIGEERSPERISGGVNDTSETNKSCCLLDHDGTMTLEEEVTENNRTSSSTSSSSLSGGRRSGGERNKKKHSYRIIAEQTLSRPSDGGAARKTPMSVHCKKAGLTSNLPVACRTPRCGQVERRETGNMLRSIIVAERLSLGIPATHDADASWEESRGNGNSMRRKQQQAFLRPRKKGKSLTMTSRGSKSTSLGDLRRRSSLLSHHKVVSRCPLKLSKRARRLQLLRRPAHRKKFIKITKNKKSSFYKKATKLKKGEKTIKKNLLPHIRKQ